MHQRKIIPGVDPKLLVRDAVKLMPDASRRGFLRGAAGLGALTFLTAATLSMARPPKASCARFRSSTMARRRRCSVPPNSPRLIPKARSPGRFRSTLTMTRTRRLSLMARPTNWKLPVWSRTRALDLDELYALPEVSQITRHICVEGWSAIGSWQGATLSEFLKRIGADTRAKYVWFQCAEGYTNTIDMPTALHPQTQMTFKFANQILPRAYGFPMKIRMPTKLGFKNPKYVVAMEVTNPTRAAIGKTRATTGSAVCSRGCCYERCRSCRAFADDQKNRIGVLGPIPMHLLGIVSDDRACRHRHAGFIRIEIGSAVDPPRP